MDRQEAIEVVRKNFPDSSYSNLQEALEVLIPELKESDGERTKRMLDVITYKMSQHQPDIFTGEENEWFNAWLEKQDYKGITEEELDKARKDAYRNELDKIEYHSGEPTFDDGWCAAIWYLKKNGFVPQNYRKSSGEHLEEFEKQGEQKSTEECNVRMKDYPYVPGWRQNGENNKPSLKHSILMLTKHGVAEGEWNGEEWLQYRWSAKVKDSDVLYWLHLDDLMQLEKEGQVKESEISQHENKSCKENADSLTQDNSEQKEVNLVEVLKHYPKETELYSPLYGKLWLAKVDEQNEIITCYKYCLGNRCTRATLDQEETVSFYSNGTTGLPDYSVSKDCMLFLYDIKKQGEQKPTDDIDADKASVEYRNYRKSCGIKDPVMLGEIESAYYEGATRQISAKWSESDNDRIEELVALIRHSNYTDGVKRKVISWIESLKDRLIPQPEHEWSEEDKSFIEDLLEYFDAGFCLVHKVNDVVDWLKSLPQRFGLQPKQGWSEEDEKMLDSIIKDFGLGCTSTKRQNLWLKSLKGCVHPSKSGM